jgi:hypothetical protein
MKQDETRLGNLGEHQSAAQEPRWHTGALAVQMACTHIAVISVPARLEAADNPAAHSCDVGQRWGDTAAKTYHGG